MKRRRGKGGNFQKFLKDKRRSRWHLHLQRTCGSKPMWEMLAFTGRFDVAFLRQAVPQKEEAPEGAEAAARVERQRRRELQHAKAEARARYKHGARLARLSEQLGRERCKFTLMELEVLRNWQSGRLREELNHAIWNFGHGRMENAAGEFIDIGGSTGGLSRKVLDDWRQPDLRDFQNFLAE